MLEAGSENIKTTNRTQAKGRGLWFFCVFIKESPIDSEYDLRLQDKKMGSLYNNGIKQRTTR